MVPDIVTPTPALAGYIAAYRFARFVAPPEQGTAPLLVSPPSPEMEIVASDRSFMLDHTPDGRLVLKPRVFVFGPMLAERAATPSLAGGGSARVLSILFRPGAAAMFLRTPAAAFTDLVIDGDCVLPRPMLSTFARALACESTTESARVLDEHFVRYLDSIERKRDVRVEAALGLIRDAPTRVYLPTVSRQVGLGRRQLERLFLEHVGVSPGRCAQFERFRAAARAVAGPMRHSLAEIAAARGYADQAHMAREFRALAGVSPSQYAGKRARCIYLEPPTTPVDEFVSMSQSFKRAPRLVG
jgi:AraC-like DNA-binding protein